MILAADVDPRTILRQWRESADLSQAKFAEAMGVPVRTYEDIETGRSKVRPVHINAAAMAMLEIAANGAGSVILPEELRQLAERAVSADPTS